MFEPIRGGTRGGQAEFKWTDVSADKDRENYLGHSINAPTGRWQKNKDIHWYNRDENEEQVARDEEIRKIKELEADALAVALGFDPAPKTASKPVEDPASAAPATGVTSLVNVDSQRALEKEEKKRRKLERKEEKRARKEKKLSGRGARRSVEESFRNEHSRERRPRLQSPSARPRVRRSMSPLPRSFASRDRHARSPLPESSSRRSPREYDERAREYERERHRRLWDYNSRGEKQTNLKYS